MILVGIKGQITSESLKGWTVIVQDDRKNTGGYLVILKNANEQYDEWVGDYKDLEKLFDTREWQVAWGK